MNNDHYDSETYRCFQLMAEIEAGKPVSQRELARRLGIAVGLVNSYLKNFLAKGYIRVRNYPRNRYSYLLTPKGFAEKTRLAYRHLSYFNNLYTVVRKDYLALFSNIRDQQSKSVIFCGVDEVAEIAFLSMQEVGLGLGGIVDVEQIGRDFFGIRVQPLEHLSSCPEAPIVVTSIKREAVLVKSLLQLSIKDDRIMTIRNGAEQA